MKTKRTSLTFLFVICFSILGVGQTAPDSYLQIDYFKVDSKDATAFEQLIEQEWQSLLDNVAGDEAITGWFMYRVTFPGGMAAEYNYVSITGFTELNNIADFNSAVSKHISDEDYMALWDNTFSLATHMFSEVWRTEGQIVNENITTPSPYMVMDYMDVTPGKEFEYLALENDIARPLHQERVNQDKMHAWRTYSLIKPGGVDYGYNFATGNYYDELNDIEFGFTNEIIKNALPGTNITEMFDAIYATRDHTKSELWELVAFARN